jgi:hypothetical protein
MSALTIQFAFDYLKHNDYILPALTLKNSSGFYPQGVFLCFVLLPQKTLIIASSNIHRFVSVMECSICFVTQGLNLQISFA